MTSVEELTAICTEFQSNFANLSVKYQALSQELDSERSAKAKVLRQLEEATVQQEKLLGSIRELKQELNDAADFKDKYRAASITIEHLKGRLETARRGVADTVVEHDQLTEQLRGQMNDLLQRIEVSSDAQQTTQLRAQVRELEERAAVVTSQLMEERERHAQQQITSNGALRELHGKNVELEQRYRHMEAEVNQMRSAVRRSMDLQNDAALQREKAIAELQRCQSECATLRRQLQEASDRSVQAQSKQEDAIQRLHSSFDEERAGVQQRLSAAMSERDDAIAARDVAEERYSALQRNVTKKISAVKQQAAEEAETLHKQLTGEREELFRQQSRLRVVEQQLNEAQKTMVTLESRCTHLESEKAQLRSQAEKAVQQEAWNMAERDHLQSQVHMHRGKLEELAATMKQVEALAVENDRLRLAIQYKDADLSDAKRGVEQALQQLRSVEEAADKRCMAFHKQSKLLKRQLQGEMLKSDAQRKKLMVALMAKESQSAKPAGHQQSNDRERNRAAALALEPLAFLQPLNDQAAELEQRIAALSQKRSPTNDVPPDTVTAGAFQPL